MTNYEPHWAIHPAIAAACRRGGLSKVVGEKRYEHDDGHWNTQGVKND
jgi:hypothetical protein